MERPGSPQEVIKRAQEIRERARQVAAVAREMRRRAQETIAQSRAFDRTIQSHRHVT